MHDCLIAYLCRSVRPIFCNVATLDILHNVNKADFNSQSYKNNMQAVIKQFLSTNMLILF